MSDFLELLEKTHREDIEEIKLLIDVDAQKYPDHKAAATLCKFIYDSEDRYGLIQEEFGNFYINAHDFRILCDSIYHALTDDGDIAFVQTNNNCPFIVFQSRWDLSVDDLISDNEKAMYESLNKFKKERGSIPLHEHKIIFFDDVYSYIEAVKQFRIDSEIQHRRAIETIKMAKRLAGREKPNLDEVEFATPHLKEE